MMVRYNVRSVKVGLMKAVQAIILKSWMILCALYALPHYNLVIPGQYRTLYTVLSMFRGKTGLSGVITFNP